jgi:HemY protein
MLLRLISLVIFLILAASLANWLASQPGYLRLEWLDWRMEIRTSLAVAILFVLALLLIFIDRLWRRLISLPGWLGNRLRQRRAAAGHKALALGLMAVSAGEPGEAKRQAARAKRLLDQPELTDLLSAQAAHMTGDNLAADRYFRLLTKTPDTAFLGYIGLARMARDDNRGDDALIAAHQALRLKPKSAMAAVQVLSLEAAEGNWAAAAPALEVIIAQRDLPAADVAACNRQRAALGYLQALPILGPTNDSNEAAAKHAVTNATRQLQNAISSAPNFWPAPLLLADHYLSQGQNRKAAKLLEAAFLIAPHAGIADALKGAWNVNEGAYVARLIKLAAQASTSGARDIGNNSIAGEAATIAAAAALAAGIEGEARRLLDSIPDTQKDVKAWQMVARLAELAENSAGAALALHALGDAMRPRGWQCQTCHVMSANWHSHCANCDGFATLEWQRPAHLTPLGITDEKTDEKTEENKKIAETLAAPSPSS